MPRKDKPAPAREWLTSAEAAELVGVHQKTIERVCRLGLLAAERPGRGWMVKREALLEFWRMSFLARPGVEAITTTGGVRKKRAPLRRAARR